MSAKRSFLAAIAAAMTLLAACGGSTPTASTTTGPGSSPTTGEVTVFAAASLTEAFTQIGEDFEAANPGTTVTFNFASSSSLVTQIDQGAPADVFASADEANMEKLTDAGANGEAPVVFATNELAIIVAKGNPAKIASVQDLTDPDLVVVTAAPQVPVGAYAAQVFDRAGITVTPKSLETDVKAVVTKVTSGEADAGIVYRTDVEAAGDEAEGVAIPAELNVVARYPIVVTEAAPNPTAAKRFVAWVTGPEGQARLAAAGFAAP